MSVPYLVVVPQILDVEKHIHAELKRHTRPALTMRTSGDMGRV